MNHYFLYFFLLFYSETVFSNPPQSDIEFNLNQDESEILKFQDFCDVSGDNRGCQKDFYCPIGFRFSEVKADCNLESSRLKTQFNTITSNTLNISKESDHPKSYCFVGNNKTNKTNLFLPSFLNIRRLKFGCRDKEENDKNGGGDCRINIEISCKRYLKPPINKDIKFMSYNIHGGKDSLGRPSLDRIIEVIKKENIDVVALQEVFSENCSPANSNSSQAKLIAEKLKFNYIFAPIENGKKCKIGNAVLSRYPMKFEDIIHLPKGSPGRSGANENRNALVVKISPFPKSLKKDFIFVSTHFAVVNSILDVEEKNLPLDNKQGENAKIIISFVNKPEYREIPFILAGDINNKFKLIEKDLIQDFNWEASSISNLKLKFAINKNAIPTHKVSKNLIRIHGLEEAEKHAQIDYILTRARGIYTNQNWSLSQYSKEEIYVGQDQNGQKQFSTPSDHYGLIFKWRAK